MQHNNQAEILHVNSKKVSCDGSRGKDTSNGHPMVYLNMGDHNFVVCPYCSKYFTIEKSRPSILKKEEKND